MNGSTVRRTLLQLVVLSSVIAMGCRSSSTVQQSQSAGLPIAKELEKTILPEYRVEPPDILLIESVRAIPKPPYKVEPLDVLFVQASPTLPDEPLSGLITVEADGTIKLPGSYGKAGPIQIKGKTIPEVQKYLEEKLGPIINANKLQVTVNLSQSRAPQRINGPHLIRPDGTIGLGTYGSVKVTGMTLPEVRQAIESVLSATLLDPEVSVDVQNYNSKLYYVILDGGGLGQTVHRLPITGNDTVLDAISQVSGLAAVSSKDRIWVSRPGPTGTCHNILPVDWCAVTELGDTGTNYQLYPGDRLFVASYPLVRVDSALARFISPIERILGVTLLGSSTVNSIRTDPNRLNNNFGN